MGGEARASDAGFESVEDGALASDGDAVEGGAGADGADPAFGFLRDEEDGGAGDLRGDDA